MASHSFKCFYKSIEDITEFIRLQNSYDSQLKIIKKLQSGKGNLSAEKLKIINNIQKVNKKSQERENYNTAFLAAIPDAMILVNQEGKIEFSNSQAEDMFGYTKEELLGQLVEKLMPEKAAKVHPQHRDNYFKSPRIRPMGRNKVNEMRIVIDGVISNITISLGISVFPNDGTSSKELIDAADKALAT